MDGMQTVSPGTFNSWNLRTKIQKKKSDKWCHCEHAALTDANIAFVGYCRWRSLSCTRNCKKPQKKLHFPELQQQPPRELVLSSALTRRRLIMMWPRPGPPSGLRGKAETGEGCWEVHQHPAVSHLSCHVCYASHGTVWCGRRGG